MPSHVVVCLQSAVAPRSGDGKPTVGGEATDPVSRLEVEIRSQEQLIAGYQAENERLYHEIKQSDTLHKQTYEKLYQQNLKTASENAQLRCVFVTDSEVEMFNQLELVLQFFKIINLD